MYRSVLAMLACLFPAAAFAAQFETLSANGASWDGTAIVYPQGTPEVTAIRLIFKPGESLPFHCHPYTTVGFVQSGEFEVEKLNGEKKTFKKGETIVEVANRWHRGVNHSKTENAELVGFYIGLKDVKNTIPMTDENKSLCQ